MRIRPVPGLALALLVLLLPAGPRVAGAAPRTGGTLVYATGTDALTLDPQFVTDVTDGVLGPGGVWLLAGLALFTSLLSAWRVREEHGGALTSHAETRPRQ